MSRTFPFDNAVVLGAGLMGRLVAWLKRAAINRRESLR